MKKKVLFAVAITLLAVVLATSLVGCLKIGLKKTNVIDRLTADGYTITHGRPPLPIDEELMRTVSTEDTFYAVKSTNSGTAILYAYYCSNNDSADRLEKLIKEGKYKDEGTGEETSFVDHYKGTTGKSCSIYRHDEIIMFGDYDSISLARNY